MALDRARIIAIHNGVARMHETLYKFIQEMQRTAVAEMNEAERVDALYALKQTFKLLDDSKKDYNRAIEALTAAVCAAYLTDPDLSKSSVEGEWTKCTPDVGTSMQWPNRDSKEYADFMKHCGLDLDAPGYSLDLLRPHWPSVTKYLSQLQSEGSNLPPGVGGQHEKAQFKATCRKKEGSPI